MDPYRGTLQFEGHKIHIKGVGDSPTQNGRQKLSTYDNVVTKYS